MWKILLIFYTITKTTINKTHTKLWSFVIMNNNAFQELLITFGFNGFIFAVYALTTVV